MDLAVHIKLILALLLGAFIGLEREYHKEEISQGKQVVSSLGVRTFSFLSLMGAVGGFLFSDYLVFSSILTISVMLLILGNYVLASIHTKDSGITTEIASLFAYAVGFMVARNVFSVHLIVATTVIATLILSRKEEIKNAVARLRGFETNAFITYAIIALVILPFLPDRSITLSDVTFLKTLLEAYRVNFGPFSTVELINPYKLWFIIALITGIDMLGYFLNKRFGQQKGHLLSAISGGFVSSTATTIALAQDSRQTIASDRMVSATIFANTASFFQLIFLLAPTNSSLLVKSTFPIIAIIVVGFLSGLYFLRRRGSRGKVSIKTKTQTEVFSLSQAFKFGLIYLLVRFGSNVALTFLGSSGVYITSALGALVGLDAVTLNLADLTARNIISLDGGVVALLIANAVNLSAKVFYSYTQGSRAFTVKFGISVACIIIASIAAVLVV